MNSINWEVISKAQLAMLNFRYAADDLTDEQMDLLNEKVSGNRRKRLRCCIYNDFKRKESSPHLCTAPF